MKKFKFLIVPLALMLGMLSCEKEALKPVYENEKLIVSSSGLSIGELHNKICNDFLNSHSGISKMTHSQKDLIILDYFQLNYGWDVSHLLNRFNQFESGVPIKMKGIDPILYTQSIKSSISHEFYSEMIWVLKSTKSVNANPELVVVEIKKSITQVQGNEKLSLSEKKLLLDMLDVFEHSVALWKNYDYSLNDNFADINSISPNDYWKIAACDFIGGAIGGLSTAGAGALPGLLIGSIDCAISLW